MRDDSSSSSISFLAKLQILGWGCQPHCLGGKESDFLHLQAGGTLCCNSGVWCVHEES